MGRLPLLPTVACIVESPWGPVRVVAGPAGIREFRLPEAEMCGDEIPLTGVTDRQTQQHVEALTGVLRTLAGGRWPSPRVLPRVDLGWATPFQREVLAELRRIPLGRTRTYGEVAARIGKPQAARAVGGVCRRNRVPLVYPCHRVVGAGGALIGFSSPGGLQTKSRLLQWEHALATSGTKPVPPPADLFATGGP